MIETSIITAELQSLKTRVSSKFLTAHILWVVGELIKAVLREDACLSGTAANLFELSMTVWPNSSENKPQPNIQHTS